MNRGLIKLSEAPFEQEFLGRDAFIDCCCGFKDCADIGVVRKLDTRYSISCTIYNSIPVRYSVYYTCITHHTILSYNTEPHTGKYNDMVQDI